jgi:hypothetical protein
MKTFFPPHLLGSLHIPDYFLYLREKFLVIILYGATDVSVDLEKVTCLLIAVGTKDIQIPLAAVEKSVEVVKGDMELHIIENMTHLLRQWDGETDILKVKKIYEQQCQFLDKDDLGE